MSKEMKDSGMLGGRRQLIAVLGVNSAALPGLEVPRVSLGTLATRALELESGTPAGRADCQPGRDVKAPASQGADAYPHFASPVPGDPRRRQDLIPHR